MAGENFVQKNENFSNAYQVKTRYKYIKLKPGTVMCTQNG